ncbi:hypothetical protein [Phycicoccus sp.]|uniref:hypothetical protein n=1 Tax=Phycicoccus sp. TaxID=1902410 RepID=UPI00338DF2C9
MPLRVDSSQVFSHALGVFATDDYGDQAVLSSSLHQIWAITYGSTLETRVRYTPSDVFETFPRPTESSRLDAAGRSLDRERRTIMTRKNMGLTKPVQLGERPLYSGGQGCGPTSGYSCRGRQCRNVRVRMGRCGARIRLSRVSAVMLALSAAARVETLDRLLLENHARAARHSGLTSASGQGASFG